MSIWKRTLGAFSPVCLAALLATPASGAVLIDFEDTENPPVFTGNATISTDRSVSGSRSLQVAGGQTAVFFIPEDHRSGVVTVTMKVFDPGLYIEREATGYPTNVYGPRWGVATGATVAEGNATSASAGATITEKTFLPSETRYGRTGGGEQRFASSWFSPQDQGARTSAQLGNGGNVGGVYTTPPTAGTGAWIDWSFEVDPATGQVKIKHPDRTNTQSGANALTLNAGTAQATPGGATQVWFYGGRAPSGAAPTQDDLSGIYVDDIVITAVPEPASLGAVALGGLLLLRRRRS
jgi:hypothetical protein